MTIGGNDYTSEGTITFIPSKQAVHDAVRNFYRSMTGSGRNNLFTE